MKFDEKTFKKLFPNLHHEMMSKKMNVSIDAVRIDRDEAEKEAMKPRTPTMPTAIDYLRRCEDDKEAMEVIDYLEKRGEISSDEAEGLRKQVTERGVRSFGKKKEWGYYSTKYLGDSTGD
ncbi:MAG: DUF2095 domain-containing protein [Nitrososphaeria archaeon]|nr:DUF2095 domain-containing protein [Nitrososphaeria archaeon]